MMKHYYLLGMMMFSSMLLTGCGLDSKVDEFLAASESAGVVQQAISGYDGIGNESVSEDMLLGRQKNTSDVSYGAYNDFSPSAFNQALESGHKIVVSVYDEECMSCTLLDKSIAGSPASIPQDLTILRIPYASGSKLYDINQEDAVIYFDYAGKEYYRSNTLRSLEELLFYVN